MMGNGLVKCLIRAVAVALMLTCYRFRLVGLAMALAILTLKILPLCVVSLETTMLRPLMRCIVLADGPILYNRPAALEDTYRCLLVANASLKLKLDRAAGSLERGLMCAVCLAAAPT